jgi:co-chaperonin GroES (HSP10)
MPVLDLNKIIVIGDRCLIKPTEPQSKTSGGLLLPPTVVEKEKVQTGYVIKVGPGYPISMPIEEDEPWKENKKTPKYIPLQAKEGDLAVYLKKEATEVEIEEEKFYVVPQSAILLLYRDLI